jgi:hypothetical protein
MTQAALSRTEIPHCNEPLARSTQSVMLSPLAVRSERNSEWMKRRHFIGLLGSAAACAQ